MVCREASIDLFGSLGRHILNKKRNEDAPLEGRSDSLLVEVLQKEEEGKKESHSFDKHTFPFLPTLSCLSVDCIFVSLFFGRMKEQNKKKKRKTTKNMEREASLISLFFFLFNFFPIFLFSSPTFSVKKEEDECSCKCPNRKEGTVSSFPMCVRWIASRHGPVVRKAPSSSSSSIRLFFFSSLFCCVACCCLNTCLSYLDS